MFTKLTNLKHKQELKRRSCATEGLLDFFKKKPPVDHIANGNNPKLLKVANYLGSRIKSKSPDPKDRPSLDISLTEDMGDFAHWYFPDDHWDPWYNDIAGSDNILAELFKSAKPIMSVPYRVINELRGNYVTFRIPGPHQCS